MTNEFADILGIIGGPPLAGATRLQEIARFTEPANEALELSAP